MPEHEPIRDDVAPEEVLASETVFRGRIWDVRRDTVAYGDGEIVREYVDHTGAVAVLALDDDDRVVVIRQYRHPVRSREWEIPAGLLDARGEDPLDAARRELAEEADLTAGTWHVLTDYFSSPGGSDEALRIYLARDVQATPSAFERTDEEADIVRRRVPLDELVDAVLARRVHNPSLVIAALAAHVSRSRGWRDLAPADAPWPSRPRYGRAVDPDGG